MPHEDTLKVIQWECFHGLVSCPTRWYLYWYLGFCDDHHPDNRESDTAGSASTDWDGDDKLRWAPCALEQGKLRSTQFRVYSAKNSKAHIFESNEVHRCGIGHLRSNCPCYTSMGVNLVGLLANFRVLIGPSDPNNLITIQVSGDFFSQLCVHTRRFTKAEGNNPASKSRGKHALNWLTAVIFQLGWDGMDYRVPVPDKKISF